VSTVNAVTGAHGPGALSALAELYNHFLLDLDGCVWIGDDLTPGAVVAVAELRRAGKRVVFITNNPRRSAEQFADKLRDLGIRVSAEDVVTAGGALQDALAARHRGATAVVIGSPAIHRHVRDAGLRIVNGSDGVARAQVVIVAGHDGFDYAELREATRALHGGAALLGATRDATFPMPGGRWPGSGAILAAVEVAGGTTAETFGKPAAGLFAAALNRLGPGRALVVGDQLDTDLAGAHAAGLDAAIVLSGTTRPEEAAAAQDPRPVAVAPTLADLLLGPSTA
jgi:HAD superfamily hydrolase (TIGR01450 family)